ncbi:glutathione S-transferase family protein [Elioraea rosea]|uniref:glutathione S-transferase family protein n=1 Tax=Elioraea rosea TaxID=2492390 RepID=UPI001315867D|nr:glutathione S-transferase family protein [Elioraea rosea]
MSAIKLYTSPLCPYAQRVKLALSEKGLLVDEISVDPRKKPDWFLTISPGGRTPLLVHNGVHISESAVINEYVEEVFPEQPLLPKAPEQRALARVWISFADWRIYEPTHRLLLCRNPNEQDRLAKEIASALLFLEKHALAAHNGPYLLGDEFSLADISLFAWFEQVAVPERFRQFRLPTPCERISAWRVAVARRSSVKSVMKHPDYYLQGYAPLFDQFEAGMFDVPPANLHVTSV